MMTGADPVGGDETTTAPDKVKETLAHLGPIFQPPTRVKINQTVFS
jgi:hypothetical protein